MLGSTEMMEKKSTLWQYFPYPTISLKKTAVLLLIAVLIIMTEEVIDVLLTLGHYAFEAFELVLEEVIQHIFHVDKATSQLYVFYILIALAAGMAIWVYRKGPLLLLRLKNYVNNAYRRQKQQCIDYWQELTTLQKILLIIVYIPLILYLGSFFLI